MVYTLFPVFSLTNKWWSWSSFTGQRLTWFWQTLCLAVLQKFYLWTLLTVLALGATQPSPLSTWDLSRLCLILVFILYCDPKKRQPFTSSCTWMASSLSCVLVDLSEGACAISWPSMGTVVSQAAGRVLCFQEEARE